MKRAATKGWRPASRITCPESITRPVSGPDGRACGPPAGATTSACGSPARRRQLLPGLRELLFELVQLLHRAVIDEPGLGQVEHDFVAAVQAACRIAFFSPSQFANTAAVRHLQHRHLVVLGVRHLDVGPRQKLLSGAPLMRWITIFSAMPEHDADQQVGAERHDDGGRRTRRAAPTPIL